MRITATYAIDARLAVAARSLRGSVTITARNDSGAGIDRLRLNTVMGPLGRLVLGAVTVDGRTVKATRSGQTITVPLGGVLPAGASATVVVPFSATLRSTTGGSTWLFTRANGITSMYRWVPWISRTTAFERPNFGDPFVTPVSPRATLRFRTDVPLKVVVNGRRTSISADGRTTTWALANVRDVVVNAAPDYRTRIRDVGDTSIRVHTRPGQPSAAIMDAAVNAVTKLEAKLGPYPWPILRIVQSSGGLGMEGPGVVWIPAGVARSNLRYLLMHEIAHQWFYGLVGNDQAREPFADEAITDMVARYLTGTRRGSRCTPGPSTRRSTPTRPAATTSASTSRAATSSTTPGGRWAARRSSGPSAATSPTIAGSSCTPGRCWMPSTPRPRWTSPVAGEPGSRPCTEVARAVARCPAARSPRHTRRRARLCRDLRAVRDGHVDLLRARAARRRRDGRPDRADDRADALGGRGGGRRRAGVRVRDPSPRASGLRLDRGDRGLRRSLRSRAGSRADRDARRAGDPPGCRVPTSWSPGSRCPTMARSRCTSGWGSSGSGGSRRSAGSAAAGTAWTGSRSSWVRGRTSPRRWSRCRELAGTAALEAALAGLA